MVGIVVLLLASALIATGLWLSIGFDQKVYNVYAVYMNEAVSGLSEDSSVKFNGVKVGYVRNIDLNKTDPQRVTLLLNIEQGTPITTSTYATLISQGITGTTYVGLSAASPEMVPLEKEAGQPYPVIPAKPSLLTQIDKVITEVSKNVSEVAREIKNIFDKENTVALKKSLLNMEKFSQVLADNSTKINKTLENIDTLMANASSASKKLPDVMHKLDRGMSRLDSTMASLHKASNSLTGAMDSGKVTLDAFSQQAIPPFVDLMNRLNAIAGNLEQVSNQMRQNPSVIIRGKALPRPGPGE